MTGVAKFCYCLSYMACYRFWAPKTSLLNGNLWRRWIAISAILKAKAEPKLCQHCNCHLWSWSHAPPSYPFILVTTQLWNSQKQWGFGVLIVATCFYFFVVVVFWAIFLYVWCYWHSFDLYQLLQHHFFSKKKIEGSFIAYYRTPTSITLVWIQLCCGETRILQLWLHQ